jgi:hypothetical protein
MMRLGSLVNCQNIAEGSSMKDKKFLDNVNPERRKFLEKVTKGAFIIPTVISVLMLNQKLNLNTANAQSGDNCLSFNTLISTPDGKVSITNLRPGMPVFTLDTNGNMVIHPIELVSKVSVPDSHMVFHLILSDGRELFVSGGHPTADGREVRDFNPGDTLDGAELASVKVVSYQAGYTYDLLPAGDTGFYWANGVLLGSTLSPNSNGRIRKVLQPEIQPLYG